MRYGDLVEFAHLLAVAVVHEALVRLDHAHSRQSRPSVAVEEGFEDLQEGLLALVVDGDVDLRVGPQEVLGLVRARARRGVRNSYRLASGANF